MARAVRRTFEAFMSGLRLDDVLYGSVVEPEGNDNYIVNLNGFNVMAYSKTRLAPGMKIRVRVNAVRPQVEIVILAENEPLGRMRSIDRAV